MNAPKTTRRAYIRPGTRHPEAKQLRAVLDAGASHVYIEATKATPAKVIEGAYVLRAREAWKLWLRSLRPGDEALVASPGRIADSRRGIADAVAEAHKRGAAIVDVASGRRSDDPAVAAALVLDAVNELSYANAPPFDSETGSAAAKAKWRSHAQRRLGTAAAKPIWKDPDKTAQESLAEMPGWTMRTAYNHFGPKHRKGRFGRKTGKRS